MCFESSVGGFYRRSWRGGTLRWRKRPYSRKWQSESISAHGERWLAVGRITPHLGSDVIVYITCGNVVWLLFWSSSSKPWCGRLLLWFLRRSSPSASALWSAAPNSLISMMRGLKMRSDSPWPSTTKAPTTYTSEKWKKCSRLRDRLATFFYYYIYTKGFFRSATSHILMCWQCLFVTRRHGTTR